MTRALLLPRLLVASLVLLAGACADPTDPPDAGFAMDAEIPDADLDATVEIPDSGVTPDAEVQPDAEVLPDAEVPDSGPPGLKLKASNLTPATGVAASPGHTLRGGLRPSSTVPASSPAHNLRGGLVPGGAQATTP